jgi:hypothetical protein
MDPTIAFVSSLDALGTYYHGEKIDLPWKMIWSSNCDPIKSLTLLTLFKKTSTFTN